MAAVAKVIENGGMNGIQIASWALAGKTDADTPEAYELKGSGDRSVQVIGTVTGTIQIQGSIDGVNYALLHDPAGNDLTFANATGLKQIAEMTRWVKPVITAGTIGAGCSAFIMER